MGQLKKQIIAFAAQLPKTYLECSAIGYDVVKDIRHREVRNNTMGQGFDIISERDEYIPKKIPKFIEVNHVKKITKAFREKGAEGVNEYLLWVRKNNEYLVSKYKMKLEMEAINEIMKNKITTIFS